jgi:hypothetical protein
VHIIRLTASGELPRALFIRSISNASINLGAAGLILKVAVLLRQFRAGLVF